VLVQVLREFAVGRFFFLQVKKAKDFFCSDELHTRVRAWKPLSPPRKVRRWLPRRKGSVCPRPRNSFFGSRVLGFWETRLVWIPAPTRLSLRGSHVRRKFRKRTTLRSESSTLIGLLYAGWRSRCECSKECRTIALERSVSKKAVIWQATINFFSRVGDPLVISCLGCTA
jgi:hypothetical protein